MTTPTPKKNSGISTPILIIVVLLVVAASVFNFVTDRTSKVLTDEDVGQAVDAYLKANPDLLSAQNIQVAAEKFITENQDMIINRIADKFSDDKFNQNIEAYLKDNADVIISSVENWQRNQADRRKVEAEKNITTKIDELENDPASPVIGNKDGDITIVEFFDYNCGYCKRAQPTLVQLLEEDKNIRVVFKEFPILSPSSELAAKAALAVNMIDESKYWDYHSALMKVNGNKSEELLLNTAETLGLNKDDVKAKMESAEVQAELDKVRDLGKSIGITGTPAFIVAGKLVPGAIGVDEFKNIIKEKRGK